MKTARQRAEDFVKEHSNKFIGDTEFWISAIENLLLEYGIDKEQEALNRAEAFLRRAR